LTGRGKRRRRECVKDRGVESVIRPKFKTS
jgi:hypothetical protein